MNQYSNFSGYLINLESTGTVNYGNGFIYSSRDNWKGFFRM